MKQQVRVYQAAYRPRYWLFEGQTEEQYSVRSVQAILRHAMEKSGLNPFATVHTQSQYFAKQHLEKGTNIPYNQEKAGHNSAKTREIYFYITKKEGEKIKNPLDNLDL